MTLPSTAEVLEDLADLFEGDEPAVVREPLPPNLARMTLFSAEQRMPESIVERILAFTGVQGTAHLALCSKFHYSLCRSCQDVWSDCVRRLGDTTDRRMAE